jgi:hypothetical protein
MALGSLCDASGASSRPGFGFMPHLQMVDSVRQTIVATFAAMGLPEPEQFRETLLLCDGNYCGRRFQHEVAQAVWFFEENEIKFYGEDGRLTKLVEPSSQRMPARMAA